MERCSERARREPSLRFKGEFAQFFGPKRRGHGLNEPDEDTEGMHELHLNYIKPTKEAPNAAYVRRPRKRGKKGRGR